MNVRIVPRDHPERTLLFGGIERVLAHEGYLVLVEQNFPGYPFTLPMREVAELLLDDEPGDWW